MRRIWAASVVVLCVAGCGTRPAGGGGGPTPTPVPVPTPAPSPAPSPTTLPTIPPMSGNWTLVHTLTPITGVGGPTVLGGTLRLVQSGTALIGTYSPAQAPTAVTVSGTLSGTRLTMQIGPITLPGVTLNLMDTGTVEGTARAATGSTAVTATLGGATLQSSGSFTMTRQ